MSLPTNHTAVSLALSRSGSSRGCRRSNIEHMGTKSRRRLDREPSMSVNPLQDLDEFKSLLDVAFGPSEAMSWISRPHDALDGARPSMCSSRMDSMP